MGAVVGIVSIASVSKKVKEKFKMRIPLSVINEEGYRLHIL